MAEDFDVIVLAGDRGPDDPLVSSAGVPGKALVPVAGLPLLTWVAQALSRWPGLGRVILVAPEHEDYRASVARAGLDVGERVIRVKPESSLSASVRAGLAAASSPVRLVLTADHALLDPAWLDQLISAAVAQPQAQVLVGVADWSAVMARFPGSRRTRYRFSDAAICGTNLFLLRASGADQLLRVWQGVEQQRKRPWRIVSLLGLGNLGRYLAGRLSLSAAFRALSERLGIQIAPVPIADPLSAVDVDSLADLKLVESVLAGRSDKTC